LIKKMHCVLRKLTGRFAKRNESLERKI